MWYFPLPDGAPEIVNEVLVIVFSLFTTGTLLAGSDVVDNAPTVVKIPTKERTIATNRWAFWTMLHCRFVVARGRRLACSIQEQISKSRSDDISNIASHKK